jgi:hypothetical protein
MYLCVRGIDIASFYDFDIQGCILSPTLFSLYINDLIDNFGPDCEPLELNRKLISCLLYADDIILLSESAKGLQNLWIY